MKLTATIKRYLTRWECRIIREDGEHVFSTIDSYDGCVRFAGIVGAEIVGDEMDSRESSEDNQIAATCTCGAEVERIISRNGKYHAQDCPMFDGDHAEICSEPSLKETK